MLQSKGYTRVRALLGGWNAWVQSGGETEEKGTAKPEPATETRQAPAPNPPGDFTAKPPAGVTAPKVEGTATGTATPPVKKKPTRKRRRHRSLPRRA